MSRSGRSPGRRVARFKADAAHMVGWRRLRLQYEVGTPFGWTPATPVGPLQRNWAVAAYVGVYFVDAPVENPHTCQ
eukprot:scaffold2414_cov54-Phaeocystis_antarctica.AAC.3